MTEPVDDTRLREIAGQFKAEILIGILESLGARASTLLLPVDEQIERWRSEGQICISLEIADTLAAALHSLPQKRAGKLWSTTIESHALFDLLDGKPIRGLAREIAEKTGQPVPSVRRRLQEMKAGGRFKRMRARRKVSGLFSTQD
jgi:hypothetical protein